MRRVPPGHDYDAWVALLAVTSRRQAARLHLRSRGPDVVPALRRGLRHDHPVVRATCAGLLDQLMDEASIPDLVAALDDSDVRVVRRALHALACDACTVGECRPGDELFVPRALELLSDPDPDVRAGAIDALQQVAKRDPSMRERMRALAEREPDSGLRGMLLGR